MLIVLGMVLGGLLTAIFADGRYFGLGVLIGGLLGFFLWLMRRQGKESEGDAKSAEIDKRLAHIYAALGDIHRRLAALEAERGLAPPPVPGAAPQDEKRLAPEEAAVQETAVTMPQPVAAMASEAAPEAAPEVPPPPPEARPEPLPAKPNALLQWFTSGNAVVKVGIVILFFGVAFLLKYAAEHSLLPIELRLTGAALGALALLAIGWRLREARPAYGFALQGGGIGLFYLTVFGAFRLYQLLPPGAAFIVLGLVAAASAVLAIKQDALALAVLGTAGGFLAPILTSTGEGSHVALFSFYAVLNLGLFAVAWFKNWRLLNLLGFVFTFVIATAWGVTRYQPEYFASTEPFLLFFFLLYLAIALLFALRAAPRLTHYVDGTLVFGTPIVGFGLQSALVKPFEFALAASALALGALYLALARFVWAKRGPELRLLVESYLALGVVFATLALPLALDGRWTSAAWALEGAAVAWMALRQHRRLALAFGLLLQVAAGVFYLDAHHGPYPYALFNSAFLGGSMIAFAGLFSAHALAKSAQQQAWPDRRLGYPLLAWGLLWWLGTGLDEIDRVLPYATLAHGPLAFAALTAAAFSVAAQRLAWSEAKIPALALPLAMVLAFLVELDHTQHPFAEAGYVAWPLAALVWVWCQRREESSEQPLAMGALHVTSLWVLAATATREVAWAIDYLVSGRAAWPMVAYALLPAALLALLTQRSFITRWPYAAHPRAYGEIGASGIALALWCWMMLANLTHSGDPWPLPYVPLLNPLDLAIAIAVLVLWRWLRRFPVHEWRSALTIAAAAAAFVWANAVLLRAMHFWGGVPYQFEALMNSMKVQTALSLFWTLMALTAMSLASRRGGRPLWFTGAALMAVVVLKLFLVDLTNRGGMERIVSFIGVGVLLLVIGYLSPLPPKKAIPTGENA